MPTAKAFIRATIHPDINVNNEILREMEKNSSLTFNDARAVVIEHLQSESARNVTLRRELFDKLFGLAMQRQKLEAMERTDAIIAITRLMDAIINDSCVYVSTTIAAILKPCPERLSLIVKQSRLCKKKKKRTINTLFSLT